MSDRLTILRCGLGRDSIAMLCLLVEDGLLADGDFVGKDEVDAVVFTDPGAEWSSTYALIPRVRAFCAQHGLRFVVQAKPEPSVWKAFLARREVGQRGGQPWRTEALSGASIEAKAAVGYYHARAPIMADYGSKGTIVALSDPSCTDNHKISPNRALLDDLSREKFGIGNREWSAAVARGGRKPHRILLGIAADEAQRAVAGDGPLYEANFYPLVELGVAKADEAEILARHGFADVHKSGCVMCKFQPVSWFWALSEREPDRFTDVVAYEARALARNPKLLIFPKGGVPLPEAVRRWREANPDATVEAVMAKDYKRCDRGGVAVRAPVEAT